MRRDGHVEIGVAHNTEEAGEPDRRDSVEGRGDRVMELLEGKMSEPLSLGSVSTRLQQIAIMARERPERSFQSIHHVIDMDWLHEAHRRTRKDGAVGIDGQTSQQYAQNLESNLGTLGDRFKAGTYRAPAVRRAHIPKGDGAKTRPIGIPTFEDKVLQRAVAMLLEAVYEQDFLDCSYGFRPGRSAHQALDAVWRGAMSMDGGYVVEVDIESYFDSIEHAQLRSFLDRRITDGVVRRMVHKWLNAGVLEAGEVRHPESGTPQGGVISPLLANIYLHEALDVWFESEVKRRLQGRAQLIRYADDFVVLCERREDAERVLDVLGKRLGRFGLRMHPDKTRLVRFERPRLNGPDGEQPRPETFDFLGFTHYWGRARNGAAVVKRKTAKGRLNRVIKRVWQQCLMRRHQPMRAQHTALTRQLQGHASYYGITGNASALSALVQQVRRAWWNALRRRGGRRQMTWERFAVHLQHWPLPTLRVVHSIYRR